MTIDPIHLGSAPNDGTGQNLRSGGQTINDNFAELDTRTATAQATAEQGVAQAVDAKAKADAAIPASALGATVAQLVNGTVPQSQLPSDVLEFATLAGFPATGESGKIYIAVNDGDSLSNPSKQYRWNGLSFVLIPSSPGSTDQVAEGATNQYFTAARVRSTTLTGLGTSVNAAVVASDTLLQGIAKLQGQVDAKLGKSEKAIDSDKLAGQPAAYYRALMGGATATASGTQGLVPAPPQLETDKDRFLCSDGTFKEVSSGTGLPVGATIPWTLPVETIPAGFVERSGQLLSRAVWPGLWAKVQTVAVSDDQWKSNIAFRGCYSSGDGSTTFRMPDDNGKYDQLGVGGVTYRGYGLNSMGMVGMHQSDQVQSMKHRTSVNGGGANSTGLNPVFGGDTVQSSLVGNVVAATGWATYTGGAVSDGSNGTPRVGSETRMANATVIWITMAAAAASAPGEVNVPALATQVDNNTQRVTKLEDVINPLKPSWISSCLVNSVYAIVNGVLWSACGAASVYGNFQAGRGPNASTTFYGLNNFSRVNIPSTSPVIKAGAVGYNGYALLGNGELWAWGYNNNGQLGLGSVALSPLPTLSTSGVLDIYFHETNSGHSVDGGKALIRKADGLYAAGYNGYGQLGSGDTTLRNSWTKVWDVATRGEIKSVWNLGSHYGRTWVQTSDNRLFFAGYNGQGQAGIATPANVISFTDVTTAWGGPEEIAKLLHIKGGSGWADSAANASGFTVMWFTDSLRTCGFNTYGQLGSGNTTSLTTPFKISQAFSQLSVCGGGVGSCYGVDSDGALWVWGYNASSQLGTGNATNLLVPTKHPTFDGTTSDRKVGKIMTHDYDRPYYGYCFPMFIRTAAGNIYHMGVNGYGEGGRGVVGTIATPVLVALPKLGNSGKPVSIETIGFLGTSHAAAGATVTYAMDSEGMIYGWGHQGQYGVYLSSSAVDCLVPLQMKPNWML